MITVDRIESIGTPLIWSGMGNRSVETFPPKPEAGAKRPVLFITRWSMN